MIFYKRGKSSKIIIVSIKTDKFRIIKFKSFTLNINIVTLEFYEILNLFLNVKQLLMQNNAKSIV